MNRALAIALAVAALSPIGVAVAASANETGRARLCFPAASWDAPDHERPCYRIRGPYEDGSGRLVIKADTIRARCEIPNVHEEPPEFALPCVSRAP